MTKFQNDVTAASVLGQSHAARGGFTQADAQRVVPKNPVETHPLRDAVMVDNVLDQQITPAPSNHALLERAVDLLESIDGRLERLEKRS